MNFFRLQQFFGKFTLVNFHLRIMFLFLLLLCIVGVIVNFYTRTDVSFYPRTNVSLCFTDSIALLEKVGADNATLLKLDDVLMARIQPEPGKSIFFHETSCSSADIMATPESLHLHFVKLSARQACAVESAALNNPTLKVFVVFTSPRYKRPNVTFDPIIEAIQSYDNVFFRNLDLWSYAAGTPVYGLLKDGVLFKSHYVLYHISDFLRYLTLWRWGGTYLDMDIVMLRSMEDVPPNYTGAESNTDLGSSVMNFAHNGFGHEIAELCLIDLQRNFDGSNWGDNGSGVITRVMKQICRTNNITIMQENTKRCMGFKVYPTEAFYAIPWLNLSHFFEPHLLEQTMTLTKNSFVAHMWNRDSFYRGIKAGKKCAYSVMAAKHCPRVYKAARKKL